MEFELYFLWYWCYVTNKFTHRGAMHREGCTTSRRNLDMDLLIQPLNSLSYSRDWLALTST